MSRARVGVLAIQGGFAKHSELLERLGYDVLLVKTEKELNSVDKLILPGGESTTMRTLLQKHKLWDSLKEFCKRRPTFGTCAGAILLAQCIDDGGAESLAAIDIDASRNSYGRQINSFTTEVIFKTTNTSTKIPASFIRAPIISRIGNNVSVLATLDGHPVVVQDGFCLACTFHPELTLDYTIHNYFLSL